MAHTLLNCLLREVSAPERQTAFTDGHLLLRLPRRGVLLRVALRRTSLLGAHRFAGPVSEETADGGWNVVGWRRLAEYTQDELSLRTGVRNEEFLEQIDSSHRTITASLAVRTGSGRSALPGQAGSDPSAIAVRAGTDSAPADTPVAAYLASEQSLLFGHRFHPTPKARTGDADSWLAYSPEAGAAFPCATWPYAST